ncbi:glycosyl hydrolase family 47-domain-containing protein [Biscogniauxia marginata]|nr:glycosyl hydrolase family 47-domain-containing protein [Biscogniauxia marginata]
MLHMRRYRYYVLFTAAVVILLYNFSKGNGQWHSGTASLLSTPEHDRSHGNSGIASSHEGHGSPQQVHTDTGKAQNKISIPDLKNADDIDHPATPNTGTANKGKQVFEYDKDGAKKETSATLLDMPDKNVGQGAKGAMKDGKGGKKTKPDTATTTTIHWTRPSEHFPVPKDEIIALPTGKPKQIPAVQYKFGKETVEARQKREERQEKVKAELERSWAGYVKYAKGHDELRPVSKTFRDPFCGWAATLVDSLDTLWITDMRDEFEEALREVEKIDFTLSTTRAEIPVFETTIRYLGGLIAAYDVSGGTYDILLQKAVELAEILMGVFDTPNRMPILYYNWKPASTSQPKRAGASVSVAELGSLAMEFTRLAQITEENKYYDAVTRITDAFYEWQERGTSLSGIFPEHVDATGCNRTAEAQISAQKAKLSETKKSELQEAPEGYVTAKSGTKGTEKTSIKKSTKPDLDFDVNPGGRQSEADKGEFRALDRRSPTGTPDEDTTSLVKVIENGEEIHVGTDKETVPRWQPTHLGRGTSEKESRSALQEEPAEKPLPECVPQGLAPAGWSEQYSMGGSQDSTYEYFPKQFLLLGGLEPKYRTLHVKATEAVKKWLLYRPMLPDNRDIRFTSKIITKGDPEVDANIEYEVTHLTCFIGAMFGVGGKIFEIPDDVEIGKKLTDGCVWAYETTPSGIMPEGAHVVPCDDVNDCHWNQTMYDELLDPLFATRNAQLEEYYKSKAELKKQKAQEERDQKLRTEAEGKTSGLIEENSGHAGEKASTGSSGIRRRAPPSKISSLEDIDGDSDPAIPPRSNSGQIPLQEDEDEFDDPARPLSHEEYVAKKIENDKLPPGFLDVNFKRYILRPEAIESVWYMYRITGDTYWQDKGWKMFNAIVSQTRTEAGNSAIDNVLVKNSDKVNEMESFWTAETLKYFYLLYSDPSLISLDEWVLNTEAHPFKRPT